MDYFNIVLTTFLGLECLSCVALYGESESSQVSSKISLCSEEEQRSYGFERHKGEQSMTEFSFLGDLSLKGAIWPPAILGASTRHCSIIIA